jgi:hypothetical protein
LEYQKSDLIWRYTNISDPAIPSFNINWREDAHRVVVVFTDEPGQSFLTPPGESNTKGDAITQEILIDAINGVEDLKVFAFSPESAKNSTSNKVVNGSWVSVPSGWEPITMAGEVGNWYLMTTDANVMFNNLMEVLEDTACSTPDE